MQMFSPRVLLIAALLLLGGIAHAQSTAQQVVPGSISQSGCASAALTPCFVPPVGPVIQTNVICTGSSTLLLAANAAQMFVTIRVPAPATATIWVNWAGAAAVTNPPSGDLPPGTTRTWSALAGFLPTAAIYYIASTGTQAVTVEYR